MYASEGSSRDLVRESYFCPTQLPRGCHELHVLGSIVEVEDDASNASPQLPILSIDVRDGDDTDEDEKETQKNTHHRGFAVRAAVMPKIAVVARVAALVGRLSSRTLRARRRADLRVVVASVRRGHRVRIGGTGNAGRASVLRAILSVWTSVTVRLVVERGEKSGQAALACVVQSPALRVASEFLLLSRGTFLGVRMRTCTCVGALRYLRKDTRGETAKARNARGHAYERTREAKPRRNPSRDEAPHAHA